MHSAAADELLLMVRCTYFIDVVETTCTFTF